MNDIVQGGVCPWVRRVCIACSRGQGGFQCSGDVQNQALRLITGAVKTAPIDAMLFTTGNKPIQELIKEKTVLLHEKLLRIPGDQYWKTHENKPRNLKTQNRFIQKVTEIKAKLEYIYIYI